jgi:hypothetical protein
MLLVLDNCEHVIAALASFVDEVLSTLPAVRSHGSLRVLLRLLLPPLLLQRFAGLLRLVLAWRFVGHLVLSLSGIVWG